MKTPLDRIKILQGAPRDQWSREFLASARERIESGRGLSPAQDKKLTVLWEEASK